uniref:Putative ovule protein n=1 Tax=Solanum chacoense TaxID=4108 RepID=A0A0V0IVT9_SOLCH
MMWYVYFKCSSVVSQVLKLGKCKIKLAKVIVSSFLKISLKFGSNVSDFFSKSIKSYGPCEV